MNRRQTGSALEEIDEMRGRERGLVREVVDAVVPLRSIAHLGDDGTDAFGVGRTVLGNRAFKQFDQEAETGLSHAKGSIDAGR